MHKNSVQSLHVKTQYQVFSTEKTTVAS